MFGRRRSPVPPPASPDAPPAASAPSEIPSASPTSAVAASCSDLRKTYGQGDAAVHALAGVTLDIYQGQFTAIMGPSGSGKSTLMHCLAGLDRPSAGTCVIGGTPIATLGDKKLTQLRRDQVGFIFQQFNLLPTLTAEENILLPLQLAHRKVDPEWFATVIDSFGLRDRLTHKPKELSGGQQQRVACARALVARPAIVFADEPTGNLDSSSSAEVLNLLRTSVDTLGQTIVMVTHDPGAASHTDRVVFIADGLIAGELHQPTVDSIHARMRAFETRTHGLPEVVGQPAVAPAETRASRRVHDHRYVPSEQEQR